MKQNKWSDFKSRMGIYLNETHGLATRQQSTMASFCGDDEILINYSTLIKNMNYIDCTRFNTDDIKCASSPRVSNIIKRCQPHRKAQFNVKKFRKNVSNKLKRIQAFMQGGCDLIDVKEEIKECKLVNFNYKQTVSDLDAKQVKETLHKLRTSTTIERKRRTTNDTYGDDLFAHPHAMHFFDNRTSSPLANNSKRLSRLSFIINTEFTNSTPISHKQRGLLMDNDDTVDIFNRSNSYQNESTQANVDAPVLLESTFNTSSCSNIDDDLIILKHMYHKADKMSHQMTNYYSADDTNSMLINKYHDNTHASFTDVPSWANGIQLNLALVNQMYCKRHI